MFEWLTSYCEWNEEGQPAGKVKVTTLHWTCSKTDSGFTGKSIGSVSAADQNRVYTLAALEAVPESVMTGWVQQALGQEEVDRIEAGIDAQIDEQANPTTGGFTPQ